MGCPESWSGRSPSAPSRSTPRSSGLERLERLRTPRLVKQAVHATRKAKEYEAPETLYARWRAEAVERGTDPDALVRRVTGRVAAPVVVQAAAVPGRLSLLYCGDHAGAKRVAGGLIADAGFVPVDVGWLEAAREVEALGRLLVDLGYGRGPGPVGSQLLTPAELSTTGG
jgi:predicted dinucleotide-binding enzyme